MDPSASMSTIFDGSRARMRQLHRGKLTVVEGPNKGSEILIESQRVVIGRADFCDITLNDKSVSNQHVEVMATDEGYILKDLESRNGIYLGQARVREVVLHPGIEFKLGRSKLRFDPLDETIDIELSDADRFGDAIGMSISMREIFAHLERLSTTDISVLVTGETGTGKEVVAKGIHDRSTRASCQFVVVDCGAIPKELVESTLFGHEKGAFTGADESRVGLFEYGSGGTIFLDEIGELDISMQPSLLRVLESKTITRVGGQERLPIDVRIVAATNRDLRSRVAEGEFREDLYYRLAGAQVHLPPLRQRADDIGILASEFLANIATQRDKNIRLGQDALRSLKNYSWPGNIRELKNVVERAGFLAVGEVLSRTDLVFDGQMSVGDALRLENVASDASNAKDVNVDEPFKDGKQKVIDAFELAYLSQLIEINNNNISRAAQQAGITRYHLRELLKRHGIAPKR